MKIITPVCNNPEFIRLQHTTFRRFIRNEPFEFIVFNDCKPFPDSSNFHDVSVYSAIERVCAELHIMCVPVPNAHHATLQGASNRHAETMNFIFSYMRQNPDEYLCIDSDMFLIGALPLKIFRGHTLAYVPQQRAGISYVWPNLFYADMRRLQDAEKVRWDATPPMDSGGGTSGWLALQKRLRPAELLEIPVRGSLSWSMSDAEAVLPPDIFRFVHGDPRNRAGKVWCELFAGCIFHYRAGSNWNGEGRAMHERLTQRLVESFTVLVGLKRVVGLRRIRARIEEYFTAFPQRGQTQPQ